MPDRAQHSHRITGDPHFRVADNTNDSVVEIGNTADIVNNGIMFDFVKQGIDGQVTAKGVFFQGAEGVVTGQDLGITYVVLAL